MGLVRSSRYASSVVEFLYPSKENVMEQPSVPTLVLPLKVGIAFVPETKTGRGGNTLGEKQKMDLMDKVSGEFKKYPFVKSIEPIPSIYLRPGGSFTNLDQIRSIYGVDVIALVSTDQVQHTDEGLLSLTYWTLVGMYIIRGERNDTSTMLDAAVYHIPSRKMLFRAPGSSHIKGSSTPVNLTEQLRQDSAEGFVQAADNMTVNLKDQLERFKTKIKEMPGEVNVVHSPGYRGGGSFNAVEAIAFIALAGAALLRRRK